jgi:hypothetical protein
MENSFYIIYGRRWISRDNVNLIKFKNKYRTKRERKYLIKYFNYLSFYSDRTNDLDFNYNNYNLIYLNFI